jgi:hypothetical protein
MKLSNFKHIETKGDSALNKEFFAEVDVTTGFLFWKVTKRRAIRRQFAGHWHFVDTGKFTPDFQAETLARAYAAQTGVEV